MKSATRRADPAFPPVSPGLAVVNPQPASAPSRARLIFAAQVAFALVLFSLHHTAAWLRLHGAYTVFSVGQTVSDNVLDQTHAYANIAHRFARTGYLIADPDCYELAKRLSASAALPAFLVGFLTRLTGSIDLVWIALQAVFCALTWTLAYGCLALVSRDNFFRSLGAWATVLVAPGPRGAILLSKQALYQPLEITRLFSPCLTLPLALAAIWLASSAFASGKKRPLILAGAVAGLLFYSYYFYWVACFAGLGLLFTCALAQRNVALFKRAGIVFAIGMAVGFPAVMINSAMGGPHRPMFARLGGYTHAPSPRGFVILLAALVYLAMQIRTAKRDGRKLSQGDYVRWLLVAILGGVGIGLNLQLLTGYDAQHEDHFMNRVFQPVGCLAFFALISHLIASRRTLWRATAAVMLTVLLSFAMIRQYCVAVNTSADHRSDTPKMKLLSWVRDHLPHDTVLGTTDRELIMLIPAVTGDWTFVPSSYRTDATDEEIALRYLILARMENQSIDKITTDLNDARPVADRNWMTLGHALFDRHTQPDALNNFMKTSWAQLDVAAALKERKLDYLILATGTVLPTKSAVVYETPEWKVVRFEKGSR